jgi:hypothetical protein
MSGGVIQGGWEFVIAAYAITAVVLLGYAFSSAGASGERPSNDAGR